MRVHIRFAAPLIVALAVLVGCASTDYLPVRYQLPASPDPLAGRQVAIEVVDQRNQTAIFGPTMSETFRHFTGNFSLRVARAEGTAMVLGAYDLSGLFRQALAQRLKQAGVEVVAQASDAVPRMTVILTQFILDHDRVQWTARVDYRVELSQPSPYRQAFQHVSASEERFRLPGSKDVERVVSDIFTTMINRLDLAKLFADVGF
jgi:hypothetical protein